MDESRFSNVLVRKVYYSNKTHGLYRMSPQMKSVGSIDITGVHSPAHLLRIWKRTIGKPGRFQLQLRDRRGRFSKKIADITVSRNGIYFLDNRCMLYTYMKNQSKRRRNAF